MKRALLVILFGLSGCADYAAPVDPDELGVVASDTPPVEEAPAPPRYRLELYAKPASGAPSGPVDLWLPLPASCPGQFVQTLVWEVVPPAESKGVDTTDAGDRLLHVRSPEGFPEVFLRAVIERTREIDPLPAEARELGARTADAWVAAAKERGLDARLAMALTPAGEGTRESAIAELRIGKGWTPVQAASGEAGLPEDTVRLGAVAAHAKARDQALPLTMRYALSSE